MALWVSARALPLTALLALAIGCGDGKRPPSTQTPARSARPTLRLVAITDLSGYLEPCGCQSRPLGGIDRAAARLRELSADGVPTLFVAAGDLLFAADSHTDPKLDGGDAEAAIQQQWQAEALAKILGQLSLTAAVAGPSDLRVGAKRLHELAQSGPLPLLGASAPSTDTGTGVEPADSAPAQSSLLVARGGVRIGLWGLSDLGQGAGAVGLRDLLSEAKRLTTELRAQGAAIVVGLLQADARTARRLASATRDLDFLVHGGSDSPEVPPPERVGSTTLLHAAHRGHGLLVLDLMRAGDGPFADISGWTRQAQRQALERRVADLAARVAEWQKDSKVERSLLAEQQARLAQMRAELASFDAPEHALGNAFSARFIELGPETPSDATIRAMLDAHNTRVNEHTRIALAKVLPKPAKHGEPSYVGSESCGRCHASELAWWKDHAHGRAYATLEKRNTQFNLSCVGCHVTGYNEPGGSTVVHNQGLTNVGCESCHGPGSLHAEDPDVDASKNVRRDAQEPVCKHCHNAEHSDRFEYATYRAKLIVPGHGQPAKEAAR